MKSVSPPRLQAIPGTFEETLQRAWDAIRRRHPDVPAAHVVSRPVDSHRGRGKGSGSLCPHTRWAINPAGKPATVEIAFVGSVATPEECLAVLLHDAAHGLAAARLVRDTSLEGRYHNRRYKELAAEVGLNAQDFGNEGWALTTLSPGGTASYREEVVRLERAIDSFRHAESHPDAHGCRLAAHCRCPRTIYSDPSTFDSGRIFCGICHGAFDA